MRLPILFYCLMALNSLFAQRSTLDRFEKTYEKFKTSNDAITLRQTIATSNGRAVSVGETDAKTMGGTDAYIVIFNPMGQEILEKRMGGAKDDGFNAVVQLPDGTFLAAGYTKSKDKKQKGWLVHFSDLGKILDERIDDCETFQTIAVGEDGAAYVFSGGRDEETELKCLKMSDTTVVFNKKYSLKGAVKNIKSAVCTTDGGVVVIGDTKKSGDINNEDIWLLKLDKQGNIGNYRQYGEANYEETAQQIIRTSDNGFALTGSSNNTNGESMNAWLLKLDELGNKQWEKTYGGRKVDYGQSVVQTADDRFYVVGKSLSHSNDARNYQIYFVKTDAAGNRLWEDYDGGKMDDWANGITSLYDGTFLMTLATESNSRSWLYRFRAIDDDISATTATDNPIHRTDWQVQTNNRFLEANQSTALSVRFTNTSARLLKNVQLKCKSSNPAIQPQTLTYLGVFRGNESKIISIPLKTSVGLEDKQHDLDMELFFGTTAVDKFTYKVTAKRPTNNRVFINNTPQYVSNSDGTTTVKLTIENQTTNPISGLTVKVELPKGLTLVGNNVVSLNQSIPAGKNAVIDVKYRGEILTTLGAAKPKMNCSLFNQGIVSDAVQIDIAPLSKVNKPTSALLVWMSPDEDSRDIQNISVNNAKFDIKLKAFINEPVLREQFKLFVDEVPINGAKMDVVDLSASSPQQQYRPIFSTSIDLEPQKRYHIRVDLQTSKGEMVSSRTLIVKYVPQQPNLHVVSIGTTNSDLKYTTKDAKNMAAFFRKQAQANLLPFKKTDVIERTDSASTDQKNIKRTINDLVRRYNNTDHEKPIMENDYLIVFISSHGKTGTDKQYKLLPSDYNAADDDDFTIDYQTDVMNQLDKIKCHKIVMIDACHSGLMSGAKNVHNAEALLKISQAAVGTTVIASCRADELSYEDDEWQNGAFTKALLEAFNNQSCSDETGAFSSDSNEDKLVTLGEIVQFIKRRVPKMVASQKRVTTQNPVLINDSLDKTVPLCIIR
jgi:Caspase domain